MIDIHKNSLVQLFAQVRDALNEPGLEDIGHAALLARLDRLGKEQT